MVQVGLLGKKQFPPHSYPGNDDTRCRLLFTYVLIFQKERTGLCSGKTSEKYQGLEVYPVDFDRNPEVTSS